MYTHPQPNHYATHYPKPQFRSHKIYSTLTGLKNCFPYVCSSVAFIFIYSNTNNTFELKLANFIFLLLSRNIVFNLQLAVEVKKGASTIPRQTVLREFINNFTATTALCANTFIDDLARFFHSEAESWETEGVSLRRGPFASSSKLSHRRRFLIFPTEAVSRQTLRRFKLQNCISARRGKLHKKRRKEGRSNKRTGCSLPRFLRSLL